LTVSAQGYAESEVTLFIKNTGRADRAFEVDAIDLIEPGVVKGVVLDTAQRPVSGARVAVDFVPAFMPLGALPAGMTRTDGKGRFELPGVRPGAITLEAYAPGVGRGRARGVRVESGLAVEGVTVVLNEPEQGTEPAAAASVAVTLGERGDELFDIVVVHVAPNSEAEHSGMAVGDILISIDGVEPETMQEARTRLSGREGSDVVVALERRGRRVTVRVRRERVRH
jgi:membrane-associated protease RseP (regulator of RpoE activity)